MKYQLKYIILLFILYTAGFHLRAETIIEKTDVIDIIYKVNTYWQETNSAYGRPFWDRSTYHTGNIAAYEVTNDLQFLDYSIAFAEYNNWKGATSDNKSEWKYWYGESADYVLFGDWQTCFQVYADLYHIEPYDYKIARAREVIEYQISTPNTDYWWWVDGLYMVMPVMTRLYNITENPLYLEKLHTYWQYTNSIMYDEDEGLYYRDANYVYPNHTTNSGKKDFWARGNGWAFAAFARVLTDLPETDRYRDTYIAYFQRMAQKLLATQQNEGYWTRSLTDPDYVPGYETSGTAFFAYGLLWGINNGYLSGEEYKQAAEKAWNYLTTIAMQENGKVGYVQPIGAAAIPGQLIDVNSTADFGVGAFLLAAAEMYKYVGGDISTPSLHLISAQLSDAARIKLIFNDKLNSDSVYDTDNYLINGQLIDGFVEYDGQRTVTITLSQMLNYGKNILAIHNLISESGAVIRENTTRNFIIPVPLTPSESGIVVTANNGIPENTLDNNLNTRWSSDAADSWIKYDIGIEKEIYAVDIAFFEGDEQNYSFEIELSTDDVNYIPVFTNGVSSGMTNEPERFSFSPHNARFVRIVCNGNLMNNLNAITEIRIIYTDLTILNNISLPTVIATDIIMPSGVIWSSSDVVTLSPTGLVRFPQKVTPVTLTATSGSQTKNVEVNVVKRNVMNNNVVLHYAFDEDDVYTQESKTYLHDKSTNGNNARVYGNARINGVLDLTMNTQAGFLTNGYLMLPDGLLDSLRSFSVLLKVNPDQLDNLPRVFDLGSASSNSIFGRLDALSFGLKYNGATTVYVNSSQPVETGRTTSLAFTFDAASKTAKIYMDGELTASGTVFTYEPRQLSLIDANRRNYIGRTQWWDTSVALSNVDFRGTMDDFYVFDTALQQDEIKFIQQLIHVDLVATDKSELVYNIYPNPVHCGETVYVADGNDSQRNNIITVTDIKGVTVFSGKTSSFALHQAGFYLVKITNDLQQTNTLKLVVR